MKDAVKHAHSISKISYDPTLFKKKRETLGLTRKELASACNLSVQTLYNIEYGKRLHKSTILLVGLILDAIADDNDMMDDIYEIEKLG